MTREITKMILKHKSSIRPLEHEVRRCAWKTVGDIADDYEWEEKYSSFGVAGSKLRWDSARHSPRTDKIQITRLVERGGKPVGVLGMRYITRYVQKNLLITHLYPRNA